MVIGEIILVVAEEDKTGLQQILRLLAGILQPATTQGSYYSLRLPKDIL